MRLPVHKFFSGGNGTFFSSETFLAFIFFTERMGAFSAVRIAQISLTLFLSVTYMSNILRTTAASVSSIKIVLPSNLYQYGGMLPHTYFPLSAFVFFPSFVLAAINPASMFAKTKRIWHMASHTGVVVSNGWFMDLNFTP